MSAYPFVRPPVPAHLISVNCLMGFLGKSDLNMLPLYFISRHRWHQNCAQANFWFGSRNYVA